MANKHVKRCSLSVVIWKMHSKMTIRYHTHTPKNDFNQKASQQQVLARMRRSGNLNASWWEVKCYSHFRKRRAVSTNIYHTKQQFHSQKPRRELKTCSHTVTRRLMIIATLFMIARKWGEKIHRLVNGGKKRVIHDTEIQLSFCSLLCNYFCSILL